MSWTFRDGDWIISGINGLTSAQCLIVLMLKKFLPISRCPCPVCLCFCLLSSHHASLLKAELSLLDNIDFSILLLGGSEAFFSSDWKKPNSLSLWASWWPSALAPVYSCFSCIEVPKTGCDTLSVVLKYKSLYSKNDWTLEMFGQKGYRVFVPGVQNPTAHSLEQLALGDPALCRGLT